jgi:hypothetical protein
MPTNDKVYMREYMRNYMRIYNNDPIKKAENEIKTYCEYCSKTLQKRKLKRHLMSETHILNKNLKYFLIKKFDGYIEKVNLKEIEPDLNDMITEQQLMKNSISL